MKKLGNRRAAAQLVGVVLLAFVASCSSTDTEAAPDTTTTTAAAPTTTTTAPSTTVAQVQTSIERVPSRELTSTGHVTIASVQYDFAFECWAAGDGDVLALGVGEDPESGQPTQAIVQAFVGQAYVAVLIGDERVLELAIERRADLFVQSDIIRGSALRFVDVQGSAGVGEDLGVGTVTVECASLAPGLPEGYSVS